VKPGVILRALLIFGQLFTNIKTINSNQMTGPQIECKGPPTEWYGPRRPHRVPGPPNLHFNHCVYTSLPVSLSFPLLLFFKEIMLTVDRVFMFCLL